MVSHIRSIWNDDRLYGHCLTNMPCKLWKFTTSNTLFIYTKPDPGTAQRYLLVFESYHKVVERYPNGNRKKIEYATNFLPSKYLEIGLRRIFGSCLTATACLTIAPIGFAIKLMHSTAQRTPPLSFAI